MFVSLTKMDVEPMQSSHASRTIRRALAMGVEEAAIQRQTTIKDGDDDSTA